MQADMHICLRQRQRVILVWAAGWLFSMHGCHCLSRTLSVLGWGGGWTWMCVWVNVRYFAHCIKQPCLFIHVASEAIKGEGSKSKHYYSQKHQLLSWASILSVAVCTCMCAEVVRASKQKSRQRWLSLGTITFKRPLTTHRDKLCSHRKQNRTKINTT